MSIQQIEILGASTGFHFGNIKSLFLDIDHRLNGGTMICLYIGPILDAMLKENSGNHERLSTVVTFVCVRVYADYRAHVLA